MGRAVEGLRIAGALVVTTLAAWGTGALFASFAPAEWTDGARSGLALGGALLLTAAIPLLLEQRVTAAIRRQEKGASAVRASALLAFNLLVLFLLGAALRERTSKALASQASWPMFGAHVAMLDRAGSVVAGALYAAPPEPPPTEAVASAEPLPVPPASASAPSAGSAKPSATVIASAPPPVTPDADLNPEKLFEARASSVVLIRSRDPVPPNSGEARMFGLTVSLSQGSGFFIDGTGLIVTNHHVVEDSQALLIRMQDGRSFAKVSLLAQMPKHDLALLSIEASGLPYAPLSEIEPKIGERAYAIGNPLGLDFTLTEGIISARRDMKGTKVLQIQTTIAPGSSGGPLFDARGRVTGVTSAGQAAGINFAVDVKHVRELLKLERKPKPFAPWLDATKVESFAVTGAELHPTSLANLEEVASQLGMIFEGCLAQPGPESAKLTYKMERSPRGALPFELDAKPETNLTGDQAACLSKPTKMVTFFWAAALSQTLPAEQKGEATVAFDLVRPREGGGKRTLSVKFEVPPTAD